LIEKGLRLIASVLFQFSLLRLVVIEPKLWGKQAEFERVA